MGLMLLYTMYPNKNNYLCRSIQLNELCQSNNNQYSEHDWWWTCDHPEKSYLAHMLLQCTSTPALCWAVYNNRLSCWNARSLESRECALYLPLPRLQGKSETHLCARRPKHQCVLLNPNPAALLGRSPVHWEDPGFCWHHAGPDDGTLSCRIFYQICSSPSLSPSCSRHASPTDCRWTQPSTWTSSSTSEVVPEWVGLLSSCLHLHPPLRWCLAQVHTGELSPVTFGVFFFFFSTVVVVHSIGVLDFMQFFWLHRSLFTVNNDPDKSKQGNQLQ